MVLRLRDVTEDERAKLARIVRAKTAPVRLVERARLVLAASEGLSAPQVAARVGVGDATARQWITRFNTAGLAGAGGAPPPGRPGAHTGEAQRPGGAEARSPPPPPA